VEERRLAPRKARRIDNGLQPQWSPIAAISVFPQPLEPLAAAFSDQQ